MNEERENDCSASDCSAEIARLQQAARDATTAKDRNVIFRKLEELTGGGTETKTLEGHTRFIRTRVDYD